MRPRASPAADPHNAFSAASRTVGAYGGVFLSRVELEAAVDFPAPQSAQMDLLAAGFRIDGGGSFFFDPFVSLPPPGSCVVYGGSGDYKAGMRIAGAGGTGRALDAGAALRLSGPGGVRNIGFGDLTAVQYLAGLGGAFPGSAARPYLRPGAYTVSSAGGADIGAFQANVEFPAPLSWTNRDAVGAIDRNAGLELAWSGADSGVLIFVANYELAHDALGVAVCAASGASGAFAVPEHALAALPASSRRRFGSHGVVALWSYSGDAATIEAPGLDAGFAVARSVVAKTVIFE